MKGICDKCGNHYDKNFTVIMNEQEYMFDCFECAISKLAPRCSHCGLMIIGHGVATGNYFFCCQHCASRGILPRKDLNEGPQVHQ